MWMEDEYIQSEDRWSKKILGVLISVFPGTYTIYH